MVTTIHGFSSPRILPAYQAYNERVHYVAISDADRCPDLSYEATVHHGIDLDGFPYRAEAATDGHVVFFGRIHPDKGTAIAIDIARAAGRPIELAGIVHDQEYFDVEVQPRLGADATYVGALSGPERASFLGAATALLHPVAFAEPFGLAVVESLACGTPVVASPQGSLPELIRPGINGFLATDVEESTTALGEIADIDRATCRSDAETRFSAERMARDYLAVYGRILGGERGDKDVVTKS
jgi:glycosyltransferase involved in cell wall biosynthesis